MTEETEEKKPKEKKKVQRIKLRIYKSPVKLDGTITEISADGKQLVVEFDGPLEPIRFYVYTENLLTDKPPEERGNPAPDSRFWEVL